MIKTKNNQVVKAIYRNALSGNYRNAVLCLWQHREHISEDLFIGVFEFIVEHTRLIDYVSKFDYYVRNRYYQMLDDYINILERRCKLYE